MSRQDAGGGIYGFIAIASIALAFFIQAVAPGFSKELRTGDDEGANRPYYEFVYKFQRLPAECKDHVAPENEQACQAIRNAEPEVDVRLHAPATYVAGMSIPAI